MSLLTTVATGLLTPEEVHDLIVRPVAAASVALNDAVTSTVSIESNAYRVPVVTADALAAWTAEGAEITPSDPTIAEITVTPSKVAGLAVVSRELANDSSPSALETVGQSLARDIARRIDAAFFGATTPNGPSGLGSLTPSTVVESGSSFTNLDKFAAALAAAETEGATVTAFLAGPTEALALAQLKAGTGSNAPLLGADPAEPTGRMIFGRPLIVSPSVPAKTVWAVDRSRTIAVVRQGATIEVDGSAFFTSDRVAVRAHASRVRLPAPAVRRQDHARLRGRPDRHQRSSPKGKRAE